MKKGLILALLMVAMASMVLPVGAKAPIVKDLPTVIVGDADELVSSKTLMRYYNAFSLNDTQFVNWNNDDSYTSDLFHAYYYADADTTIKLYNESTVIAPLSGAEYTALQSGTVPPAATRITSATADGSYAYWKMNFWDVVVNPVVANPAAATAADGYDYYTGIAADYNQEVELTLVCGVTSGTKLVVSAPGVFTVISQHGADDGAEKAFETIYDLNFSGGAPAGWAYSTSGQASVYPALAQDTTLGIGFNAGTTALTSGQVGTGGVVYGKWQSPDLFVDVNESKAGLVYRFLVTMKSTASTAMQSLGYRLNAFNRSYSHQSFFQTYIITDEAVSGAKSKAISGSDYTARMYMRIPFNLTDMKDTDGIASSYWAYDGRDYTFAFEGIGSAGQLGRLAVSNLVVETFNRPAPAAAIKKWGTPNATSNPGRDGVGAIAFNDATSGWRADTAAAGWTQNPPTLAVGSVTFSVGTVGTTKYTAINNQNGGALNPKANNLYRFAMELACADQTKVPGYRIMFAQSFNSGTQSAFRDDAHMEWFNHTDVTKSTTVKKTGQTVCPVAPTATAGATSLYEFYIWSHNQNATQAYNFINPTPGIWDAGEYTAGPWGAPTSNFVMSYAVWEDLGTEF